MTILDIEDILYTGTKENIKKVLKHYKPGDVHHLSKLLYFGLDFLWTSPSLKK